MLLIRNFDCCLIVRNLLRGTCGAHKVGSPLPTNFFSYARAIDRIPNYLFNGSKSFTIWTNLLVMKIIILLQSIISQSYKSGRGIIWCKEEALFSNSFGSFWNVLWFLKLHLVIEINLKFHVSLFSSLHVDELHL